MKRVLLDEGVPRPLAHALKALGINALAFPNDWKQLSNGALLEAVVRSGFDVLISSDKSMPYQQSIEGRELALLILPTNHLPTVIGMAEHIARAIPHLAAGEAVKIGRDGVLSDARGDR